MTVGIQLGSVTDEIGSGDFLHAFFSSISGNLEADGWGTRFQTLVGKLYGGELHQDDAIAALSELNQVKQDLAQLPPSRVIWDIEHRDKAPPWEGKISAEQDYLLAKNAMQEAEIAVQNAQQKLASLGGAGRVGGSLTRYEIRSPIDGVVVEKHLSLGEAVQGDAKIFVIADLSTVWAEMTVAAKDLNAVRIGQTASIKATAFTAETSGKVSYVGALVGEQTRSAKARVVLPNPQGVWRPGLQVNVELVAGTTDVPVAVAATALQKVRGWTVVFGRYGEYLEARPLELGRSDGKFVEVVSGLHAGEVYASANSFLIKADLEKSGASHDH